MHVMLLDDKVQQKGIPALEQVSGKQGSCQFLSSPCRPYLGLAKLLVLIELEQWYTDHSATPLLKLCSKTDHSKIVCLMMCLSAVNLLAQTGSKLMEQKLCESSAKMLFICR